MSFITYGNFLYGTMDHGGDLENYSPVDTMPRQKFKFTVFFPPISNTSSAALPFPALSVQLPEISFEGKVVQQYNVKKFVQQKANYGTCTFTIIDTFDNRFTDSIYLPYVANYYNGGNGLSSKNATQQFAPTDNDNFSTNLGYSTQRKVAIPSIGILMDGGGILKAYTLHNCFITSITNDTLDYSESAPVTYVVTVQPELITIDTPGNEAATESAETAGIDALTDLGGLGGNDINQDSDISGGIFGDTQIPTDPLPELPLPDLSAPPEVDVEDLETETPPDPEITEPTETIETEAPEETTTNYFPANELTANTLEDLILFGTVWNGYEGDDLYNYYNTVLQVSANLSPQDAGMLSSFLQLGPESPTPLNYFTNTYGEEFVNNTLLPLFE